MSIQETNRDMQRASFIENLHCKLKKQATKAIEEHKKNEITARNYISDGLEESECIELLMIDGLNREAAECYTLMALSNNNLSDDSLFDYDFKFEDDYGKVWSSYDIKKIVKASNDKEAWEKAEELMYEEDNSDFQKIVSVHRVN